ncbi:MAG TPA: hypothetical protein G4O07_04805 [Dehalococcoidia bacterium]|nr:hypothetical protein [Dehalococcoidia bacterium]
MNKTLPAGTNYEDFNLEEAGRFHNGCPGVGIRITQAIKRSEGVVNAGRPAFIEVTTRVDTDFST